MGSHSATEVQTNLLKDNNIFLSSLQNICNYRIICRVVMSVFKKCKDFFFFKCSFFAVRVLTEHTKS